MEDKEYKRLLERAAAYCAKAERSAKEVSDKLHRWAREELPADLEAKILDALRADRFIDEERYVSHFVRDKVKYLAKGPYMLRRELRQKGISDAATEEALAAIPESKWEEQLRRYLLPKLPRYRAKAKSPGDLRRRLMTAAFGRGYPIELAETVIDELMRDEPWEE